MALISNIQLYGSRNSINIGNKKNRHSPYNHTASETVKFSPSTGNQTTGYVTQFCSAATAEIPSTLGIKKTGMVVQLYCIQQQKLSNFHPTLEINPQAMEHSSAVLHQQKCHQMGINPEARQHNFTVLKFHQPWQSVYRLCNTI